MAARIVSEVPLSDVDAAIDGCQVRAYSASAYGSGGIYEDPWELSPELFEVPDFDGPNPPPRLFRFTFSPSAALLTALRSPH